MQHSGSDFSFIPLKEKETTAYHEAGHAIVAIRTEGADPVHKITIIPRGQALGVTMQVPMDEKHGYSKPYVEGRLAILMGGRAAEMLIFDKMTTSSVQRRQLKCILLCRKPTLLVSLYEI